LIDISDGALAVAKKNYDHCIEHNQIDKNMDVIIEEGNLFSSFGLDQYLNSERFLSVQE
jgi:hypothetical protein